MIFAKREFVLLLISNVYLVQTSKILMITLAGTKSHKIPFLELAKGLAEGKHNVTFINAFPTEVQNSLIEEINPTNLVLYIRNFTNWDLLGPKMKGELPVPVIDVFKFGYQVCEAFLSDRETKTLMQKRDFDLLILDGAYPECAVGLAYYFQSPFIYINTVGFYTGSLSLAGNPTPYSITPYLGLPYSDNMNILQRLTNTMYHVGLSILHNIMVRFFLHQVLKTHISPNIPNAYEMSKNVSLIFQNGHFSLTYPRPYLPSVVEIACLHCRPAKPLPQDLEDFINAGNNKGFIYVSMGSSVKASNMPEELRLLFTSVFQSLPYQVLWKWESVGIAPTFDLPRNVLLSHWFPQQDILGHPKIRAFVTHGGLLSLFETVFHGVPVVAMPVFCDHDSNVEKSVQDGYAIRLELRELTASKLLKSVTNVINDPKYKRNAIKRSALLKDQLESPLERAVFWTEYVLRHNGGQHLQSPSKEMTFISYYLIDVIILTLVLIYSILYLSFFILRLSNKMFSCNYRIKIKVN